MFTGIVQGTGKIVGWQKKGAAASIVVEMPQALMPGLAKGASIAINGACLTVTHFEETLVAFDLLEETLNRTNLKYLSPGIIVNIERAAKFGDEIGGHLLSGHIIATAKMVSFQRESHQCKAELQVEPQWAKYLFAKGYVALDGISLTIVDTQPNGIFSVHLIPETMARTNIGLQQLPEVNIEIDANTQAIVDTLERLQSQRTIKDVS